MEKQDENNQKIQEHTIFEENVMTGSYGEISNNEEARDCFERLSETSSLEGIGEKKRPDSLILTQNLTQLDGLESVDVHKIQHFSEGNSEKECTPPELNPDEIGQGSSGLSELQGTLTYDGDLVTFVAEDLQEKIKMSSPVWADSVSSSGMSSSHSCIQSEIHVVDATVLTDLEIQANKIATCVDQMLENLSGTLQSISSLTVDCMESYEKSVCKTCDAVDVNIKAIYQLMAKCEELSKSMSTMYLIAEDVLFQHKAYGFFTKSWLVIPAGGWTETQCVNIIVKY